MVERSLNPTNKRIKLFFLLSFLLAIVNIYSHPSLFQNVDHDADPPFGRKKDADKFQNSTTPTSASDESRSEFRGRDLGGGGCFRARNDTVPRSRYEKLKPPFVNLGFPKMGTSSLHSFFACAGYSAMHYRCNKNYHADKGLTCADCMRRSVDEGLAPFAKCGQADAYSQLDNGSWGYFPQIEYLEEIVRSIPNGTFFLTFRDVDKWYHSMTHWPPENDELGRPHMSDGLRDADITGFPSGMGKNREEFGQWFCDHVRRVRDVVARHPRSVLVEVDLDDPEVGARMADTFDVDESCWGRRNVNVKLHPEHDTNRSTPELPWLVSGKFCIRGKTKLRMRITEPLPHLPGVPPHLLVINDTCK